METSETTVINDIVGKFESALPDEFSFKPEDKWIISKDYVSFDFAIYYNRRLYAIVELKTNIYSFQEKIKQYVNNVECRFGILTNGKEYYLYDSIKGEGEKLDIEQIVKKLISSIQDTAKSKASRVVDECLRKLLIDNGLEMFVDKMEQDVLTKWRFNDLDTEQKFFLKIFNGDKPITEFCRYTSLDSLIRMLNDETYQMCGIVGMNDKSEIDYFDRQILGQEHPMPERVCNDVYISSGTSLKDKLTMWRLYGDDGKGVCLIFEVKPSTYFYIANVSYAEDGNSHKWVGFIKEIINKGVKFNNLNVWKHFFKPHDYNVEEEIRLMFYEHSDSSSTDDKDKNKKEWIKANGSSIVIPIKRFDMSKEEFPLTLKTIILGPKINEPDLNKVQIESMVKNGVTVERSSIENYR